MAYKRRRAAPKRRLQKIRAQIAPNARVGLSYAPIRYTGLRGGPGMRLQSRPLASRSYTATVTKQQKMHQTARQQGMAGTFSYFNYGGPYKPAIMKNLKGALAKQVKVLTNAGTISSSVGKQGAGGLVSLYTVTDLKDMCDDVDASVFRKIFHIQCKSRVLLTNQDNGVSRIILYDVIARRDSTNDNYDAADTAWYNGAVQLGDGNMPFYPGSTPYSVPAFTQNYKILKTTHIQLSPGQLHEHRISFRPHKMLGSSVLFTSQHDTLKGFSCFTMIVCSGGPSNDTVNNAQVSLGTTKVDFVCTKEYKYCYLDKSVPTYNVTNTLPTAFTNGEEYMSVPKGEKVASAQA